MDNCKSFVRMLFFKVTALNNIIFQGLPSSSVTSMCNNKRNIMFLQNIKTKCIQFLLDERNSMLNAAEYFENVYVIAAPALLNITSIKLNFQRVSLHF